MIVLREKSPVDRAAWLEGMWAEYEESLRGSGMSSEEATATIARHRVQLFVDDEPVAGQFFFDAVRDDEKVGSLWLAQRPDQGERDWYVYDVVVDEAFRGQGLGRATMLAGEGFVRSRGGGRLGLNVFGPNGVARRLYESMGYQTIAVSMFKDLG